MLKENHTIHIFNNMEMDALFVTLGMLAFAEGLISIFVPVYFWKLDFSIAKILLFYLLHSAWFLLLMTVSFPLLRKLSDKMMMFLSIPFLIAFFMLLGELPEQTMLFWALPIATATNAILFNAGYNINFAAAADRSEIGKEVGMRSIIASAAQMIAPLFGGLLIQESGFQYAFWIGSTLAFLAIVPLFFFPTRNISHGLRLRSLAPFFKERELLPFNISGIGYAMEIIIRGVVWPLFIFIAIGTFAEFGGIISIGMIATAVVTYFLGSLSDYGKRRNIITWTTVGSAFIWFARTVITQPALIVGTHIFGNVVNSGLTVAWTSQYYKITKTVSDAAGFIISREMLYNATRVIFIPILIVIANYTTTATFFSISFAIAALVSLLYLTANKTHGHLLKGLILEHVDEHPVA